MPTTYTRIILTADDILTWAKEKGLVPTDGEHKAYHTNGERPNSNVDNMALLNRTEPASTDDAPGNYIVITNENS